jgi:succinate-semialdehyde dehydrogenase/glutarate-semialdehyde dehydrogenase
MGAYGLLLERVDLFAEVMTLEMGKPLAEARGEVAYGAEFLRWFAEEAVRIDGRYQSSPDGASRMLVTKRPVGPCLFITPWNYPLAMVTRKLAPALAAGCTSVLKPAPETPLTALAFVALLEEVGLPPGVLNAVTTTRAAEVTAPLIQDRRLRKLSFTGSTAVGRELLSQAASNVLRTSMELGGNAPFIVFDDADLPAAVAGAMQAKLRNMGEACTAANRFIVHERVAEKFSTALSAEFSRVRLTNTTRVTSDGMELGPLIDANARDSVHALVTAAVDEGAAALTGGQIPDGEGFFYPATVLTGVASDSEILRSEIFGPVAPVVTFTDENDAVRLANDTELGLVAYVFTQDLPRALRMTERLEVGMIGLNRGIISNPAAPFGGVKHSGLGREGGTDGIDEFLEIVFLALNDPFKSA